MKKSYIICNINSLITIIFFKFKKYNMKKYNMKKYNIL